MEQRIFFSKHDVFLKREFLLKEDSGSKVELGEVQDALTNVSHLTEPKVLIHKDELEILKHKRFVGQVEHMFIPKRYGFLISEHKDILLIEDDEPTTYEESLNSSKSKNWLIAMKS